MRRTFALVLLVFAAIASAREITAGKPLARVKVKLARYAGAQFGGSGVSTLRSSDGYVRPNDPAWLQVVSTDDDGKFTFAAVEKGRYVVAIEPEKDRAEPAKQALVRIEGTAAGRVNEVWDFATKRRLDTTPPSTSRNAAPPQTFIVVESNGVDALTGVIAIAETKR